MERWSVAAAMTSVRVFRQPYNQSTQAVKYSVFLECFSVVRTTNVTCSVFTFTLLTILVNINTTTTTTTTTNDNNNHKNNQSIEIDKTT